MKKNSFLLHRPQKPLICILKEQRNVLLKDNSQSFTKLVFLLAQVIKKPFLLFVSYWFRQVLAPCSNSCFHFPQLDSMPTYTKAWILREHSPLSAWLHTDITHKIRIKIFTVLDGPDFNAQNFNSYMCRSVLTAPSTQLYWKVCRMQLPWIIITRKDWSIGQMSPWMSSEEPLSMEQEPLVCRTLKLELTRLCIMLKRVTQESNQNFFNLY